MIIQEKCTICSGEMVSCILAATFPEDGWALSFKILFCMIRLVSLNENYYHSDMIDDLLAEMKNPVDRTFELKGEKALYRTMSRRDFLRLVGATATGLLVAGCMPSKSRTPSTVVTKTPTSAKVAIAQATDYDPKVIYKRVRDLLDNLGGLKDVVSSGDRVAIKVNLTGGTNFTGPNGLPAIETYITHPEIVRALGQLVRDAGAREIFITEAVYEWGSYTDWGYEDVAKDLDATLVDLNGTRPYSDYATIPVPGGGEIYKSYIFNHILQDVDVFMSVSKMKCHWSCGVTHTMKNLIGLVPAKLYRLTPKHNHRSAFHGPDEKSAGYRLPRIITELNRTRPIHLAVIDGIKTTEAGEGPWLKDMSPVAPGVLFAGKNALATDTVATAAMGFDPNAASMSVPFVRSDNHLKLARELGMGTNHLEEIDIVGSSIGDVLYDFKPAQ